jgi:hypothetical protein
MLQRDLNNTVACFAETYGSNQALLATITVPPASHTNIYHTKDPAKALLAGRNENSTTMCYLCISDTE